MKGREWAPKMSSLSFIAARVLFQQIAPRKTPAITTQRLSPYLPHHKFDIAYYWCWRLVCLEHYLEVSEYQRDSGLKGLLLVLECATVGKNPAHHTYMFQHVLKIPHSIAIWMGKVPPAYHNDYSQLKNKKKEMIG